MITSAGLTPSTPPTLELVNKMLTDSGHPKIIVIDEYIQLEDINHDFSGVDPLENDAGEDKLVTFLPDLKMGDFYWTNCGRNKPFEGCSSTQSWKYSGAGIRKK